MTEFEKIRIVDYPREINYVKNRLSLDFAISYIIINKRELKALAKDLYKILLCFIATLEIG